MEKGKLLIFALIVTFFLVIIGIPYAKNLLLFDPVESNTAQQVTLKEGIYTVGKDLKAGMYDINVLSDATYLFGMKLNEGDSLQGMIVYEEEKIEINSDAIIEFSPSSFKKLEANNNQYIIEDSGNYLVGKQIEEGEYIVSYEDPEQEVDRNPFIQVSESVGKDISSSFNIDNSNQIINVHNGNVLFIANSLGEEYNHVIIVLTAK